MQRHDGVWWAVLGGAVILVVGYALYQLDRESGLSRLPPAVFLERSGRTVSVTDLQGQVTIVGFFFSCCQASCPAICQAMQELQRLLWGTDVRLVLISVDPETDRPERLQAVAESLQADQDRWWFLTQPEPDADRLFAWIEEGFGESAKPQQLRWYHAAPPGWDIVHSNRLFLLDRRGRIRHSELVVQVEGKDLPVFVVDELGVHKLAEEARRLAGPAWFSVRWLPTVNVLLNATSLLLLTSGYAAIRLRRVTGHRFCMLAAACVSALFLLSYSYYHWQVGHTRYPGEGWWRIFYLTVLASHVILAASLVGLVPAVLFLAIRRRWSSHKRLARWTLPIWIYVCFTGILVYGMLYWGR